MTYAPQSKLEKQYVPRTSKPHTVAPVRRKIPAPPSIDLFQRLGATLQLGSRDDPHEHEAEAAASEAVRRQQPPDREPATARDSANIGEALTNKQVNGGPISVPGASGSPLPVSVRQDMEHRFGRDLSGVRLHLDRQAERAASAIEARAFAVRNHVYFGRGEFRPGSPGGVRLLAHELSHTLQPPAPGGPLVIRRSPGSSYPKNNSPETKPADDTMPESTAVAASAGSAAEVRARELTEQLLVHIKEEAKKRAAKPKGFPANSPFVTRLKEHYLDGYLANPSPQSGASAMAKIGAEADVTQLLPDDEWEQSIPNFTMKAGDVKIAAATEILKLENRKKFSHFDGDVLLGGASPGTSPNNDFVSEGANESQLMHWATGVKYSHLPEAQVKRGFVGYEIMHLEGWGEFGLDSINDLIVEEQGRILGLKLRAGTLDGSRLNDELIESFAEARAWVGSLISAREAELKNVLFRDNVPEEANWSLQETPSKYWESYSLYSRYKMVSGDESAAADFTAKLKVSKEVGKLIDIYTLIEESTQWQSTHSAFTNDALNDLLTPDVIQTRMAQVKADWEAKLARDAEAEKQDRAKKAWGPRKAKGLP